MPSITLTGFYTKDELDFQDFTISSMQLNESSNEQCITNVLHLLMMAYSEECVTVGFLSSQDL